MNYTGYELLWLFLCYSFLGWVLETVAAALRQKRLVNRGLINGPFCVLYGTTAVIITVYLHELDGIWLFLGSMIFATVMEWVAGHLIEKFYHERWWDYSDMPWNLDGYICLPASVLWGMLGYSVLKWQNEFFAGLFSVLPELLGKILIFLVLISVVFDCVATLVILSGKSKRQDQWEAADALFTSVSSELAKRIIARVERRISRAYPQAKKQEITEEKSSVFAYGCGFYKVVMLFFVGAFLGDITETIYCRLTAGIWMSRSSVVWGPFSIVWGLAIAAVTALLYQVIAALIQPISDKRMVDCVSSIADGSKMLLRIVFTTAILFLLTIAVVAATTGG